MSEKQTTPTDEVIGKIIDDAIKHRNWQRLESDIHSVNLATREYPQPVDLRNLKAKPSCDKANLLNDWGLERQQIVAIVGPTGSGKSVMAMQLATHFACGKETVGFRPNGVFKVLVLQNEDSDNDIAFMKEGTMQDLVDDESKLAYENLTFIRLRGIAGKTFLSALDWHCEKYHPDIIFVNPILKYFGNDPLNSLGVNEFLDALAVILEKHNCGMIFIHHTIKQNQKTKMMTPDPAYAGFGSAAWSNGVRDTISIRKCKGEDGTYCLYPGKRGSKWGWTEKFIRRHHVATLPMWSEIEQQYVGELKAAEKANYTTENNTALIIKYLPKVREDAINIDTLMSRTGMSEKTIRKYVKGMMGDNIVGVLKRDKDNKAERYYLVGAPPKTLRMNGGKL